MNGIGDEPTDLTRKHSRKQKLDQTTEPTNQETPQQEYEKDFDHMLSAHEEGHESLAGRLNSKYPNSLEARHFALRVLHWKKHGLFTEGELTAE